MKKYFTIIFFIAFCYKGVSQQANKIDDESNFLTNRWEALLSKNVSASFRILSFVSSKPKIYTSNDTLQVHFYMVDNTIATKVNSSKIIQDSGNYQMLVKNQNWEKGWNVFKPWPIKDVIADHNISAKNLGVLVRRSDKVLLPALITKTSVPSINMFNNYDIHFFTPSNIIKLTYKVINETTNEVIDEGVLRDIDATSSFKLNLEMKNKISGKYKLMLKIAWINGTKNNKNYKFYHYNKK